MRVDAFLPEMPPEMRLVGWRRLLRLGSYFASAAFGLEAGGR